MASSSIHLAIAKKYMLINALNDRNILIGTLYPDSFKNKDISHYTDLNRKQDLVNYLAGKVNLYSFILDHENLNGFELGWFLHLVTDYLFFDECFSKEYLCTHSFEKFREDLYLSYDSLCDYVLNRYNITLEDYTVFRNQFFSCRTGKEILFTKEMIDCFIDRVSSINMSEYIMKIKLNKCNVKPY